MAHSLKILTLMVIWVLFPVHLYAQSRISLGTSYMVMSGGTSGSPIYLTVDNNNSNAIVHSSTGHILSSNEYQYVKWFIGTNTGNYVFPFGVGVVYIPFVFNITAAGSGSGNLSLATWYTLDNIDVPDGGYFMCPDENSAIDRFWIIDPANYTTNPTADIQFHYYTAELDGIPEPLLLAQRGNLSLSCPWESPVGTAFPASDYVEVLGLTAFSPWTLSDLNIPLPIELLDFTADWKNQEEKIVSLNWTTSSEINNDYFEIQRSSDALNFITIGTMISAGNSNHTIHYAYEDTAPIYDSISYYRLKQVDFDGYYTFSNIEVISPFLESDVTYSSVYPNPSTGVYSILCYTSVPAQISINIYDMPGRLVYTSSENLNSDFTKLDVDISHLAAGSYILEIATKNHETVHNQILIKK